MAFGQASARDASAEHSSFQVAGSAEQVLPVEPGMADRLGKIVNYMGLGSQGFDWDSGDLEHLMVMSHELQEQVAALVWHPRLVLWVLKLREHWPWLLQHCV